MIASRLIWVVALAGTIVVQMLGANEVLAQNYPGGRTVRLVTAAPGGSGDLIARLVAQGLSKQFGSSVIVENKNGAVLAIDTVAQAAPDGLSLLVYANSMWVMPLMQKTDYDPIRDFAPITFIGMVPNVLVVNPSVQATTVPELIALAKANPGKITYASSGTGSSTHLAGELFKSMTGTDMLHVPFKSPADAVKDLVGDHVQVMFATSSTVTGLVKSGKLRALGVATLVPSTVVPGLPTVAQFVPGYESAAAQAAFAPAKTPQNVISLLNKDIITALQDKDIRDKLFNAGVDVSTSTPDELARSMKNERDRLGKVIRDAGIKAE